MSSPTLDLRDLPPPQPMQHILDALQALPRGARLVALTPLYPEPLLAMLQADGYVCHIAALARGHRVTICHGDDADLLHATEPAAGP